ncbi:hypothetical protein MKX03_013124 [Papaver bracteatum]|nr:hypothetical protein MKX03_013124 [Papaver bracteatum]
MGLALLLVFMSLFSIIQCKTTAPGRTVFSVTDFGAVGNGETYDTHHVCLSKPLSAIKFGSDSRYDFKGIAFDSIDITDSHRGITMQLNGGGKGEDIVFTNINVNLEYNGEEVEWRRSHPIYITTSGESSITNLKFINITSHSEKGVILSGGSRRLQNVELMNVNLTFYRMSLDYIDGLHIENMIMKWIAQSISLSYSQCETHFIVNPFHYHVLNVQICNPFSVVF